MTKRNYLDAEQTLLHTPKNLYDLGIKELRAGQTTDVNGNEWTSSKHYWKASSHLKEALLFGEAEAAYPLAFIHSSIEGVGLKDPEKATLWLMIGRNLGSQTAADILRGDDTSKKYDVSYLMSKIDIAGSKAIEDQALKYSKAVEFNRSNYIFTNGLSKSDVTKAITKFDSADSEHTLTIMGETNTFAETADNSCIGCVIL